MNKRQRTRWLVNLALFIFVLALLALLLLNNEEPESTTATLTDYVSDNPQQIIIDRPGKERIRFQKQDTQWAMTEPYQHAADSNVLGRLLSIRNLSVTSDFSAEGKDLSDFGLSPAIATVQFDDVRIDFGGIQPVDKKRYIYINGQVLLVDDQHINQLNTGSISYLDRQIIPTDKEIQTLEIDEAMVELNDSLRNQWQSIKASWLSLSQENDDTNKPLSAKVQLKLTDGSNLTYTAIRRDIDVVLIKAPLEYHLPHTAIETLGLTSLAEQTPHQTDASTNSDQAQ